jgi:hypothetical protein
MQAKKSPDFWLYEVDARALESLILAKSPPIEKFAQRAKLDPGTYARLLDPQGRRTFRAVTIKRVMRELGITDPAALVVGELSEEDLKNLKVSPPQTRKNHDLKRQYEKNPPGGSITWREPRARRRDLRRHGALDDEEAV